MPQYLPQQPSFADNQVASAHAQLNQLRDGADYVLGAYLAGLPVFTTYKWIAGYFANGWGVQSAANGLWTRIFTGSIRHKVNTFYYSFTVVKDATYKVDIRMQVGDSSDIIDVSDDANLRVAAGAGTVTVSGSASISSHSLTVNEFYPCNVDVRLLDGSNNPVAGVANAAVTVNYIREGTVNSYSALASFATGSTPTSAQWQALSDRVTALHGNLSAPRVGFISRTGTATSFWQGTLRYVNKLLYYDLRMRSPFWKKDPNVVDDGNPDTSDEGGLRFGDWFALIYVNGTLVKSVGFGVLADALETGTTTVTLLDDAYFAAGDYVTIDNETILLGTKSGNTWTGCTRAQKGTREATHSIYSKVRSWSAYDKTAQVEQWYHAYRGTVDLTSLALTEGSDYLVRVDTYYYDHSPEQRGDGDRRLIVYMMQNQPDATPELIGWATVTEFDHGSTVGSEITDLRDNITYLSASTRARDLWNYPCHKVQKYHDQYRNTYDEQWFYRYHRWLHYRIEPPADVTASPVLEYWHAGKWNSVGLDSEPNKWLRVDLDSIEGLYEGTRYMLKDVTRALEDDDA